MFRRAHLLLLAFVVAMASTVVFVGAGAYGEPAVAAALAAADSDIEQVIARSGRARVIVTLTTENGLETPDDLAGIVNRLIDIRTDQRAVTTALAPTRSTIHRHLSIIPASIIEIDAAGLEILRADPRVDTVHLDERVPLALDETVPVIGATAFHGSNPANIGAGTAVAILDTGIDIDHPMFSDGDSGTRIVDEACFSSEFDQTDTSLCPQPDSGSVSSAVGPGSAEDCDPLTIAGCGHGTHVAGIAAGTAALGGSTLDGVAPGADIIAIKVFVRVDDPVVCEGDPVCALSYTSDQLLGLERVEALSSTHDIVAVNMSLGGGRYTTSCDGSNPLAPAVHRLRALGIATVIASGNDGWSDAVSSPACISSAVTVGATNGGTTPAEGVTWFSNTHPTMVDLYAPGQAVRSAVPDSTYATYSGTSMAAPHVAGALALLRAAHPELGGPQLAELLADSGVPIDTTDSGTALGFSHPRIALGGVAALTAPPANDTVVDATTVTLDGQARFTAIGSTLTASTAPGDPIPSSDCAASVGPSIWYRWTSPSAGTAALSLDGSDFDTVLAVWTGSTVSGFDEVACNDDVDPGIARHSELAFTTERDQTYLIQVSGWSGDFGGVALAMEADLLPLRTVDVNLAGDGSGTVTSTGDAVDCGGSSSTCTTTVIDGESMELRATSAPGSTFVAWTSNCVPLTDPTMCDVTITADTTITAWFRSTSTATAPTTAAVGTLLVLESLTSTPAPVIGELVTVSAPAGTFDPHERVIVSLHSDPVVLADVDAGADGSMSTPVTIPVTTPAGAHSIAALGVVSGNGVRMPVTVRGVFTAVSPARVLDTRSGVGASAGRVGALDGSGSALTLQIAGRGGVPSSGVSAVALNVTVVDGRANDFGGFVTVFPCGSRPDASNLNFISGQTVPNSVISPLSATGTVCLYVYGTAHLLADVSGFFTSGFEPVTSSRLLDTRSTGTRVGALDGSGQAVEVQVTGRAGVPTSASAAALNVTVVDGRANDFGGFVTVFPCGMRPDASNLNFISGQTVPNSVIAPLSASGTVCLYVYGSAHLLADVSGYVTSGFAPLTPSRLLDTRSTGTQVGAVDGSGRALTVQIAGRGGVPSSGVAAVALNVTVVDGLANDFGGFVTVFPCGTRPDASNLNFISGQTVPNSVIAPLSATGTVCLYVYGTAHLLVDISGHL